MFDSTATDVEFHRWLNTAVRRNLGAVAADEYYRTRDAADGFDPYTVTVDGRRVRFPLYTTDGWRDHGGGLDEIVTTVDGDAPSDTHEGLLGAIASQLAHRNGDDIRGDVDIRDYLWDGPVYTPVSGETGQPRFGVRETNYFTHLSTAERLAWEVYGSLYDHGVSPDAGRDAIRREWEPTLPYRQRVAGSISDGVGGGGFQPLFGVTAMVAINDGDGYQVPFLWRDPQLAASPCQYGLVGGVYDPESDGLRNQLLREVVEELLGGEEGEAATAHTLGRQLISALDEGRASLDYLRTVVDAKWLNHHVRLLFVIDDAELGRAMLENHETNFEAASVEFVDVTADADWIRRMASVETLSPMGAPCVFDGVRRLAEEYNANCPVDVSVEAD